MDGTTLSPLFALPFIGLLLSIAIGPVLFTHFWEKNYGKITFFWITLVFFMIITKTSALPAFAHVIYEEYIPFIVLIFALYTTSGGLVLRGNLHGSPLMNTFLLAIGALLASFVGTTGASMIMIRPFLRANDNRRYNVHSVVFFIFIISNIGGSLTPLGDPPLFIGYLKGVDFFWTTKNLWVISSVTLFILLLIFYVIDRYYYKKEENLASNIDPTPDRAISLVGKVNFVFIGAIILILLLLTPWKSGINLSLPFGHMAFEHGLRDFLLLFVAFLSIKMTPKALRIENNFSFAPIIEVAKLFLGIFICMIPVIAMLQAGKAGAFAPLISLVTQANGAPNYIAYFWLTGIFSSFLDNAPTYLMFFELAGGNPQSLMNEVKILTAISLGAVFMGANSYIGNAPNFMVYAIAKDSGVKMPSFFGYMLWSGTILIPLFIGLTLIFF